MDHPAVLINPQVDRVSYRGREIRAPGVFTYLVLNKPAGYLVSKSDPHHFRTIYDLLNGISAPVFPVGRLDLDTWGVLLLTDDGGLNFRLTHPSFGVEKTYRVQVMGIPSSNAISRLRKGIEVKGKLTAPAKVCQEISRSENGVMKLTIHEGRKRQIKQMCNAVGHPIVRLERILFGGISADGLAPGCWRHLTSSETCSLKRLVGLVRCSLEG